MLPKFVVRFMVFLALILCAPLSLGYEVGHALEEDSSFDAYTDKPFELDASKYLDYFQKNEYFNGTFCVNLSDLLIAISNSLILDLPFNGAIPEDKKIIKAFFNRSIKGRITQYQLFVKSSEDVTNYIYLGAYARGDNPQALKNQIINFKHPSNSFILKGLLWDSGLAGLTVYRIGYMSDVSGDKHIKEEESKLYLLSLMTALISIPPQLSWVNRFSQATSGTTFLYSCIRFEHFFFAHDLSEESERKSANSELFTYVFGIPILLLSKYYLPMRELPHLRITLLLIPHVIGNIVDMVW